MQWNLWTFFHSSVNCCSENHQEENTKHFFSASKFLLYQNHAESVQEEKERKDGREEEKAFKEKNRMSSSLSLVQVYNGPSHDLCPAYLESCWQARRISVGLKPTLFGSLLEWSFGASIVPQLTSKIVCNLALDFVALGVLVTFTIKSKSLCLCLY